MCRIFISTSEVNIFINCYRTGKVACRTYRNWHINVSGAVVTLKLWIWFFFNETNEGEWENYCYNKILKLENIRCRFLFSHVSFLTSRKWWLTVSNILFNFFYVFCMLVVPSWFIFLNSNVSKHNIFISINHWIIANFFFELKKKRKTNLIYVSLQWCIFEACKCF